MAGESAAHMILFIATILIATSVSAVMMVTIQKMSIEIEDNGEAIMDYISTDFEIINDPSVIPQDNGVYVFYVKNTGDSVIPFTNDTLTVLIDGSIIPKQNFTTNVYSLKTGEVGEIRVYTTLSSGDHRITIILHNGLSNYLDFTI